jgi:nitrate reductase NapE component
MTPASSAATERKLPKLIVVSLLGVVAIAYLGAYFFLLFLKLAPT